MIEPHDLLAFLAVCTLAYVVPGPDWFVVLRRATRSRRDGFIGALGVQCGLVVHLTAAAVGVSAVLVTSAEAFTVVKLVGAAYLAVLGLRALRDAARGWRAAPHDIDEPAPDDRGAWGAWATAFAANVLNPKAALFFVAVLPQFVSAGSVAGQVVVLGVVDIALGLVWWTAFVLLTTRFQGLLRRRRARAGLDAVSGVALTGLGGALALTRRAA